MRQSLDAYLLRWLEQSSMWSHPWKAWAKHTMLGAGKALRPSLIFDFYLASSRNLAERPPESVLHLALGAEFFHTFTLIHDDLPCMDDDDFRRGRPTLHRLESESTAVLMGDALHAATTEIFATSALPVEQRLWILQNFSRRMGAAGLFEGQRLDIEGAAQSLDDLIKIHSLKTGELFSFCCEMGVLAGAGMNSELLAAAATWGQTYGLLFQVADDLMDASSTLTSMGKTPGKDSRLGRKTILDFMRGPELRRFCDFKFSDLSRISSRFGRPEILQARFQVLQKSIIEMCK